MIADASSPERAVFFKHADLLRYHRDYLGAAQEYVALLGAGLRNGADSAYCYNQLCYLNFLMNRDTQARFWLETAEIRVPAQQVLPTDRADYWFNKGLCAYRFFTEDSALQWLAQADSLYDALYGGRPHLRRAQCKTERAFCITENAADLPLAIRIGRDAYEIYLFNPDLQPWSARNELLMASIQGWSRGFETAVSHVENCINLLEISPWVDTVTLAHAWAFKARILCREAEQTTLDAVVKANLQRNCKEAFAQTAALTNKVQNIRKLQFQRYLALYYLAGFYGQVNAVLARTKTSRPPASFYYRFENLKNGQSGAAALIGFLEKNTDLQDSLAQIGLQEIRQQAALLDQLQREVHQTIEQPQYFYSDDWLSAYSAYLWEDYSALQRRLTIFLDRWERERAVFLDQEDSFHDKTYALLSYACANVPRPDFHAAVLWAGKMINNRIPPEQYKKWPVERLLEPDFYKDYPYSQAPFNSIGDLLMQEYKAGKSRNINLLHKALRVFQVADSLFVQSAAKLDDNAVRYYEFDTSDKLYSNALNTLWMLQTADPAHAPAYARSAWFFTERMKAFILFRDHPSRETGDSVRILKKQIDAGMAKTYRGERLALRESQVLTQAIYTLEKMRLYRPADMAVSDLKTVGEELAPHEAVISFFWGTDQIYRVVVSREGARMAAPVPLQDIDYQIDSLCGYFQRGDTSVRAFSPFAAGLYQSLLGDLKAELNQKQSWIFIPGGKLFLIPFECLLREGETTGFQHASFLIKQPGLSVAYSPAWRIFEQNRAAFVSENKKDQQVFYFGSSQVDSWEQERNSISRAVPADNFHNFSDDSCSREHFLDVWESKQPCGILHLCAHGENNPGRLSNSKIWFGDGPRDTLYDYELSGHQRRDVNLVVLSSCRSAYGKNQYSEGVYSISRCFLQAGARSVLASMWNLSSATNPPIMDVFYEKYDRFYAMPSALAEAKREFIKKHTDCTAPVYWASMILIE